METQEQLKARVDRAVAKIKALLDEENCELEPFLLISQGQILKKEVNVIAKPLPGQEPQAPVQEPVAVIDPKKEGVN